MIHRCFANLHLFPIALATLLHAADGYWVSCHRRCKPQFTPHLSVLLLDVCLAKVQGKDSKAAGRISGADSWLHHSASFELLRSTTRIEQPVL